MRIWHLALLHLLISVQCQVIRIPLYFLKPCNGGDELIELDYYANITIGDPPQTFRVKFSTISTHFWVPGKKCEKLYCMLYNKYDSSRSTSFKKNNKAISIRYLRNRVWGILSSDTVNIGGVAVPEQTFIEANNMTPHNIYNTYGGILGLSRNSPILVDIVSRKLINKAILSVYFKPFKRPNCSGGISAGEIILGGTNSSHYKSKMYYIPLNGTTKWIFQLESIKDSAVTYCHKNCLAVINTEYPFIGVPKLEFIKLTKAVGAEQIKTWDYEIECDRIPFIPKIYFQTKDTLFSLHGKDYIYKVSKNEVITCILGFKEMDYKEEGNSVWVLGNLFIKNYYTELDFEKNRVGFAEAV